MDLSKVLEDLEESQLPTTSKETAADAVGFAQAFHDFVVDASIIPSQDELDVHALEKALESFLAELSAAVIFLASASNAPSTLQQVAESSKAGGAPDFIVRGYYSLAKRVAKTQEGLK